MLKNTFLLSGLLAFIATVAGVAYRLGGIALAPSDLQTAFSGAQFFTFEQALPLILHNYSIALLGLMFVITLVLAFSAKALRLRALLTVSGFGVLLALPMALSQYPLLANNPALSTALHFMLGSVLVWYGYAAFLNLRAGYQRVAVNALRLLAGFSTPLMLVALFSGVWMSVNGAAQQCNEFPACDGQWLTALNLQAVIDALLSLSHGELWSTTAATLVMLNAWHRVLALLLTLCLLGLASFALLPKQSIQIRRAGLIQLVLLALVFSLGVASIHLQYLPWVAVAHSAFAIALMLPLLVLKFYSRHSLLQSAPESVAVPMQVTEAVVAATSAVAAVDEYVEPEPESLYQRLKSQLQRTRSGLGSVLATIPLGQKTINADLLEDIEAGLIMADVGMEATTAIIRRLTDKLERKQLNDAETLAAALKSELLEMLQPCSKPLIIPKQDKPYVILVVGINGAGKTTTIGKMAKRMQVQGHNVMLAAGDTFRAAAVEQLQVWGERNHIHVVAQHTGADSASVIYDAVQSAAAKNVDVLIADTAGRLHTKSNLMDELKKVKRIMARLDEAAPHEILLVLDAGTGQNALSQAKVFNEAVGLTGLVLTKLDGTAKGGVIFALAKQFGIPIRYIGVGEAIDDLQDFNAEQFVDALLVRDE